LRSCCNWGLLPLVPVAVSSYKSVGSVVFSSGILLNFRVHRILREYLKPLEPII
jgi:hypothetical protein